jgi:glutamine cyclotransferase
MKPTFFIFYIFLILSACTNEAGEVNGDPVHSSNQIPIINFAVTKTHPHDTTSFTEGFLVHDGKLYESTGSPDDMPQTRSLFGIVDTSTGKIEAKVEVDREYFGEGICFLNNKVYQLTYQHGQGFIYDANNYNKLGAFKLPVKEGWGMTTDGEHLIISDGTNKISFISTANYNITKQIKVSDNNGPVMKVNELEFIDGFIYANVYGTTRIIKINASTGEVVARIELGSLAREAKARYSGSMEMNGIAYDSVQQKTFVTGKMWPIIYEIQFQH